MRFSHVNRKPLNGVVLSMISCKTRIEAIVSIKSLIIIMMKNISLFRAKFLPCVLNNSTRDNNGTETVNQY